ncbi:MAG: hypothetical protein ACOYJJ_02085 [Anaerovoracaceae bacterium]|jgi:hypothetical protein
MAQAIFDSLSNNLWVVVVIAALVLIIVFWIGFATLSQKIDDSESEEDQSEAVRLMIADLSSKIDEISRAQAQLRATLDELNKARGSVNAPGQPADTAHGRAPDAPSAGKEHEANLPPRSAVSNEPASESVQPSEAGSPKQAPERSRESTGDYDSDLAELREMILSMRKVTEEQQHQAAEIGRRSGNAPEAAAQVPPARNNEPKPDQSAVSSGTPGSGMETFWTAKPGTERMPKKETVSRSASAGGTTQKAERFAGQEAAEPSVPPKRPPVRKPIASKTIIRLSDLADPSEGSSDMSEVQEEKYDNKAVSAGQLTGKFESRESSTDRYGRTYTEEELRELIR